MKDNTNKCCNIFTSKLFINYPILLTVEQLPQVTILEIRAITQILAPFAYSLILHAMQHSERLTHSFGMISFSLSPLLHSASYGTRVNMVWLVIFHISCTSTITQLKMY